jgi:hypothetical protein
VTDARRELLIAHVERIRELVASSLLLVAESLPPGPKYAQLRSNLDRLHLNAEILKAGLRSVSSGGS